MPYLPLCLEALQANAKGLDVEILFQDGGSTDGSLEVAQKALGTDHVFSEPDLGPGDAANRAWKKSTGEILGWSFVDDYFLPGSLQAVHDAFEKNPTARWVIGCYQVIDANGLPVRRLHVRYKNFAVRRFSRTWLLMENIVPAPCVFFRRDLWEEAGEILTEQASLANDYEYWLRLSKIAPPLILNQKLTAFRWHESSTSGRRWRQQFKDELRACYYHTRNPLIRFLHTLVYLRNIALYNLIRW